MVICNFLKFAKKVREVFTPSIIAVFVLQTQSMGINAIGSENSSLLRHQGISGSSPASTNVGVPNVGKLSVILVNCF